MTGGIISRLRGRFGGEEHSDARMKLIVATGAAAVLLIALSGVLPSCGADEKPVSQSISADEYAETLEKRLSAMVSSIDGAGRAEVMVTLKNSVEYVYASEDRMSSDSTESVTAGGQSSGSSSDSQSSYIVIDGGSGEQALVRTELMPTVGGVTVVCDGASDPEVAARITDAVAVALDISPKRVCVVQRAG